MKRVLSLGLLLGLAAAFPAGAQIQTSSIGNNVVYKGPGQNVTGSSAMIDASVFHGKDICAKINAVLTATTPPFPARGAVIDARGILGPANMLNCESGSPWQGTPPANGWPPATILLPPTGIVIYAPWVLPNGTRIIGERRNETTILAGPTFPIGGTMIQMGSSDPAYCPLLGGVPVCKGIGIQYVSLDGEIRNPPTGAAVNGISNPYSQDLSYVDHVDFRLLEGTGITVGPGAANSGPYSNMIFAAGGGNAGETTQTACIVFQASTRGLHGITCTANGTPYAAVHLQAGNNSIENIHVEGFVDGVVVGDTAAPGSAVTGDVLMSVDGGFGGNTGPIINVIHICNPQSPATGSACTAGNWTVSDLTVLGVSADHNTFHSPIAIQDDISDATLHTSQAGATEVSLYVLGEPLQIGNGTGYSRFSSTFMPSSGTPLVPSWGAGAIGSAMPPTPCATGTIFTNTNSSAGGNNTMFVCVGGTSWAPVIGTAAWQN